MPNPGRDATYVTLSETVDNTPIEFYPPGQWAEVEPLAPDTSAEQRITHRVGMRYHPQLTLHTVLTTDEGRQLFVRGIQQVKFGTERVNLICEEVLTP